MREAQAEYRVSQAQKISRMCFVCGQENALSPHTQFLALEDGRLMARFTTADVHQGYPGRVHGGVISAIIDETIGRVLQIKEPETFSVTIDLNVKFRKPVPVGVELAVVAWETKNSARVFEGQAQLVLADGTVAVTGSGRYLRLPLDAISDTELTEADWFDDSRDYPESVRI